MKIYKLAVLPLEDIAIDYGSERIDYDLEDGDVKYIENKYKPVSSLGGGMWGVAYVTNDGKVLKLTKDINEYSICQELQKLKHSNCFVDIFETEQISTIFIILKEKLQELNEEQKNDFNSVIECLYDGDEEEEKILRERFSDFFEKVEDYYFDVTNYAYSDTLSSDNIGFDQYGTIKCFDPTRY